MNRKVLGGIVLVTALAAAAGGYQNGMQIFTMAAGANWSPAILQAQ